MLCHRLAEARTNTLPAATPATPTIAPLTSPLPRATAPALPLTLSLTLAHETVGTDITKGRFHRVGLRICALPVPTLILSATFRPGPVAPPAWSLARHLGVPLAGPCTIGWRPTGALATAGVARSAWPARASATTAVAPIAG